MRLYHTRHKRRCAQSDKVAEFSTKSAANPRQESFTYIMVYEDNGRDCNRQKWQRQKLTQHAVVHRFSRPPQVAAARMMIARHAIAIARFERMDVCGREEEHRQKNR